MDSVLQNCLLMFFQLLDRTIAWDDRKGASCCRRRQLVLYSSVLVFTPVQKVAVLVRDPCLDALRSLQRFVCRCDT